MISGLTPLILGAAEAEEVLQTVYLTVLDGRTRARPGPDDWGRNFFPPELVMQHQSEIGLQDSQRTALTSAVQQAQAKFMDVQWKLSAEGEKMARLLQGTQVDETQVLEQVDRILALEREIKRGQISLMVRIKNTLTAAQQAKLAEIRNRKDQE